MYSNISKNVFHPVADFIFGTSLSRNYRELQSSQWWSAESIKELQAQKLNRLIKHAYQNVPYYNELFNRYGVNPDKFELIYNLKKIPVLTKETARNNLKKLKASNAALFKPIVNKTGGSTGSPFSYLITKEVASACWAGIYRGWNWAGYEFGDKRVTIGAFSLGITGKTSLFNHMRWLAERNYPLQGMRLTEEVLDRHVKKIIGYKPKFIRGFPSAVYALADYCNQNGIDIINPMAVFTTSETLLPQHRRLIEKQFKCEVFNNYGAYDGGIQAFECEKHNGLHISAEKAIVEVLDEADNPVQPGQLGRIVVTDLHNYAMPFIRYEVGDTGALSKDRCSCGRGLPLLSELGGRISDALKFGNGISITGPAVVHLFSFQQNIKQYQVVQKTPCKLLIKIVKNKHYVPDDEERLLKILSEKVGKGVAVELNYCKDIPKTIGGKHRFIINECPDS